MRRVIVALVVVCASVAAAAEPEKEIDAIFAEWSGTRTPGCAVATLRDDRVVFERAYGMANLEHHVAITPRSVFGIQSTSKQFVAMAIVLLIQDGKLAFDDDVRKYVPELPDYGAKITIRHLLEHSSGLRDVAILTQDQGLHNTEILSHAYVLRLIARQKSLNHPPGAAASYTNSGYFLLSLIVQRVAGEPTSAFMKRRIFEPLGMSHTEFRDTLGTIIDGRVTGYRRNDDGTWRVSDTTKDSVFTTLGDLVRWNGNFAHPVVGGEEAIRWMTTWGKLDGGFTTEWGLGLSPLRYRGLEGIYFSGGGTDGTSVFARFPNERFTAIVLCNGSLSFNAEVLGQKVVDVSLAAEIAAAAAKPQAAAPPDPAPVAVDVAELRRYAGLYFSPYSGPWRRDFRENGGKLQLVLSPERAIDLIPLGGGRFRAPGSSTEYHFRANQVRRTSNELPDVVFDRVDRAFTPDLGELAGTYHNDEVEADVVFSVRDGKLHVAFPNDENPSPLEPAFRDAFADGPLMFRFRRDARGRVVAVTKHWDRVWELRYVRAD